MPLNNFIVRTRRLVTISLCLTAFFMVLGSSIAWGNPLYWLTLLLLAFTGLLGVLRFCGLRRFQIPLTTSDWVTSGLSFCGLVVAALYALRTPQWIGFYPALLIGLLVGLFLLGLSLRTYWKEWLFLTGFVLLFPLYTLRFASLFPSIAAGSKGSLELLLRFGADPNERQQHNTALGEAVRLSRLDMIDILSREGADVNARSSAFMNGTPIIFMAAYTQEAIPVLGTLLLRGADPNARNNAGETALFAAIRSNHLRNAQELLEHGADVNARNANGETALFAATTYEAAKLLLNRGCILDIRSKMGRTALFSAVTNKNVGLVNLLLETGLSINEVDSYGQTPLLALVSNIVSDQGREPITVELDVIRYLLAHGVNVNQQDRAGRSALTIAQQRHAQQLEKLLRATGAH